jgi:molybdenum cofactor synthesis domain-containing protein
MMKTIKTQDAVGSVLCHDLTRIVKDQIKETAFRKGHIVQQEDLELLLSMGKKHLYVWELGPEMLHENEAAMALKELFSHDSFLATEAREGRINLKARENGLFLVDLAKLEAINDFDDISVAVRISGTPVSCGDVVAGFKVIPLVVDKDLIEQIKQVLNGSHLMEVKPYLPLKAAIIATGSEVYSGLIKDQFTPVVESKLLEFGIQTVYKTICDDDLKMMGEAIDNFISKGVDLLICTGGMSVDPDDLTPGAIRAAGAEVVSYGAPTFPGAVLLMAYIGKIPVLGLPGCVMFGKRTIFDILLPRIAAGLRVTRKEIRHLGHGGICLSCPSCIFPSCAFGRGWAYSL